MKVSFHINGVEHGGEARELSTLGAFVVSSELPPPGQLKLVLKGEGAPLDVPGEVVQARPEGFSVVFEALAPETLSRLIALLGGDTVEEVGEQELPPPQEQVEQPIPIRDDDWVPPLSKTPLPPARSVPGPDSQHDKQGESDWDGLPTISAGGVEVARMSVEPPPAVSPTAPKIPPAEVPRAAPQRIAPAPAPAVRDPRVLERRVSERHELEFPITFENVTSLIKEFTHNISFGGLLFYTDRPVRAGTQVAVTLVHPVHGQHLTLPARVVRAQDTEVAGGAAKRIAVGVEFLLPLPELQRLLSDFISSHQRAAVAEDAVIQEARALLARPAKTPAEVLDLSPGAPLDEVRKVYFGLVDRYHPDRHRERLDPEGLRVLEELFRVLTRAYEELSAKR